MTPELFQAITLQGGCVDLSRRAKFRLTGADRVRWLNGQVTNDVRRASAGAALHACVTNAKGRIEAEVFIHASPEGDAMLLDADAGLRDALAARLERYIIADDVLLEDVTEEWALWHGFGGAGQEACLGEPGAGAVVLSCLRFGAPGCDVWLPASCPPPRASCPVLSAAEAGTLRILRGIPQWPDELNGDVFPQEAGLEAVAMDFAKGCYIGQEVLSRLKMTGKVPRRLVRFTVPAAGFQPEDLPLPAPRSPRPTLCVADGGGTREAGTVTSAVRHPVLDRIVGLAYVRAAFEGVDSLLLASGDPPRILGNVEISSP